MAVVGEIVTAYTELYLITGIRERDNRTQYEVTTYREATNALGMAQGWHSADIFRSFLPTRMYVPNPPIVNHECYLILYQNETGEIRPLVRATFEEADRWIRNNQEDVTIVKRTKVTVPYTLPTE